MENFSGIELELDKYERELESKSRLQPVEAWNAKERQPSVRRVRIEKTIADYRYYRNTYFTPEMFSDGYSKPGFFQNKIIGLSQKPGVQIVAAARKHAKTVEAKIAFSWLLLTNRLKIGGTLSSTLPKSRNILDDIGTIIAENPRINEDFEVNFAISNSDQLKFNSKIFAEWCYMLSFSEERSVKGYGRMFGRPQKILCDDIETRQSPLGEDQVEARVRMLAEAYGSLGNDGTIIALANNFDEKCMVNRLKLEKENGLLPDYWNIHIYPAWYNGKPLWKERYPAKSEAELRDMLKPYDESEWQGDYMQNPVPPDGFIFPRDKYTESKTDTLPADVRGVSWCDPNLSLKGKGDTTAMMGYVFSPKTMNFYAVTPQCKSYGDANQLLDDYFKIKEKFIYSMGFDGNVAQEATWTNFVRSWCQIHGTPFPRLEYRRYKVDLLSKNAQAAWNERRIIFPKGFSENPHGKRFLTQLFTFTGKKAGKKDDAPDCLISAHELIHERGLVRRTTASSYQIKPITDNYSF